MHEGSRPGELLRVLFVDFATHFGGAILSLSDVLKGLREEAGVVPFVLTFQDRATVESLFGRVGHLKGRRLLSHVTRSRCNRWAKRWLRFDPLVWAAMRLYTVADYAQELLLSSVIFLTLRWHHIHVLHLNNGPDRTGIRAAKWAGVPVVGHVRGHGGPIESVTPLQRRLAASPVVIAAVAISRSVADSIVEQGMPRDKVTVIHNPVDIEAFDEAAARRDVIRSKWGFTGKTFVAGAFGRIMRYKGQEDFLWAAAPLFTEHPELRLFVVGDSSDAPDQDYLTYLKDLAGQDPFSGRVVFAGYQTDVAGYFWACDLVVHSSRGREGFGRVVAEGMAASRAVIAMDEAGPKDIVTHGVDGLLVPPRNLDALTDAMRTVLESSQLRETLGANGRRTVEERFSVPVISDRLASFYRSLGIVAGRQRHLGRSAFPAQEGVPRS